MPKILIADDEAYIVRVIAMWLRRHGYDTVEASDGAQALEILDHQTVDLIISDMNMPEVDGLELVRVIREERGLDVPILLLSARCDQEKLSEQMEPYHVRLYPKPFVPSRLVADIERLLNSAVTQGMENVD